MSENRKCYVVFNGYINDLTPDEAETIKNILEEFSNSKIEIRDVNVEELEN